MFYHQWKWKKICFAFCLGTISFLALPGISWGFLPPIDLFPPPVDRPPDPGPVIPVPPNPFVPPTLTPIGTPTVPSIPDPPDVDVVSTPEPSVLVSAIIGLGCIGIYRRR